MKTFTTFTKGILLSAAVLFLGSCMKESTPVEPTPQFYLTFYNAYAGADNVIPKINGQSLLQNQNTYAFG